MACISTLRELYKDASACQMSKVFTDICIAPSNSIVISLVCSDYNTLNTTFEISRICLMLLRCYIRVNLYLSTKLDVAHSAPQ